jgi:hypothetical protein
MIQVGKAVLLLNTIGILIAAIGIGLNQVVAASNGNSMPYASSCPDCVTQKVAYHLMNQDTRYPYLGDVLSVYIGKNRMCIGESRTACLHIDEPQRVIAGMHTVGSYRASIGDVTMWFAALIIAGGIILQTFFLLWASVVYVGKGRS